MKNISFLLLFAALGIILTSCDNDPIETNEIGYTKKIFPEPYTIWGNAVSDVMDYMEPFGFNSTDAEPGDIELADGTTKRLYVKYFSGINPYDANQSRIIYNYYFERKDGGLKAIRIQLIQYSQFKFDEITAQFTNSGYRYDGFINSQYYLFSNDETTIKCYLASHSFVFSKKGDPDELTWN